MRDVFLFRRERKELSMGSRFCLPNSTLRAYPLSRINFTPALRDKPVCTGSKEDVCISIICLSYYSLSSVLVDQLL